MNNVDNPFESLPTLSICTGIRGLERGVERVIGPLRTVAYVEIEAFIIENLLAGMEAGLVATAPIWANLETIPWQFLRGKIFLLLGGYPCQPFSTAGLRLGKEDPRHLWPHIECGIEATRPVCVFFENVSGHLSLGFQQVANSLRAMGYAVEAGIYTSEEVGAPHRRARLFILGILADAKRSERRTFDRWRNRINTRENVLYGNWSQNSGGFEQCGEEVADAVGYGAGTDAVGSGRESQADERKMEREERNGIFREWRGGHPWNDSAAVGNADSERLETDGRCALDAKGGPRGTGLWSSDIGPGDRWPAEPGYGQFDWEAPRVVESGLGCSINGYNFREDLLRALGNGVVEQQCEVAILDLLRKHFD